MGKKKNLFVLVTVVIDPFSLCFRTPPRLLSVKIILSIPPLWINLAWHNVSRKIKGKFLSMVKGSPM